MGGAGALRVRVFRAPLRAHEAFGEHGCVVAVAVGGCAWLEGGGWGQEGGTRTVGLRGTHAAGHGDGGFRARGRARRRPRRALGRRRLGWGAGGGGWAVRWAGHGRVRAGHGASPRAGWGEGGGGWGLRWAGHGGIRCGHGAWAGVLGGVARRRASARSPRGEAVGGCGGWGAGSSRGVGVRGRGRPPPPLGSCSRIAPLCPFSWLLRRVWVFARVLVAPPREAGLYGEI